MTVAKYLTCACLWMTASAAQDLIAPTAIDWLLDCPLPTVERLDPEVLQRTQCGVVSVPRNYAAPPARQPAPLPDPRRRPRPTEPGRRGVRPGRRRA